MSDKQIDVACTIFYNIERTGRQLPTSQRLRFLLIQRPPTTSFPWQWAFVGGKLEPGETPIQAAFREIQEEINWMGPMLDLRYLMNHNSQSGHKLTVFHYECDLFRPYPSAEVLGYGWFTYSQILSFAGAMVDLPIITTRLLDHLGGRY